MTMTLAATITRTELALSTLNLNSGGYKVIAWGPGETIWRRSTVASAFIDGRFLVSAVKDQTSMLMAVRATGSSKADCMSKMGALIDAFEQFTYTLSAVIDGTTFSYSCEPADWSWGDSGEFQKFHNEAYKQEATFMIPRFPNQLAGPA